MFHRQLTLALLTMCSTVLAQVPDGLRIENAFKSYDAEVRKTSATLGCTKPRVNQASGSYGALYTCIGGKKETVKWFINENAEQRGTVQSVKLLWNQYTRDVGYGIAPDGDVAKAWTEHLASLYAPGKKRELQSAFNGKRNQVIKDSLFTLTYTYTRGPAVDERMFVVTKASR